MTIQHGMDGALRGDPDIAGQATHQELPDLAGTPMGLVLLEPDDRALHLVGQLVGIAHRPARAIGQCLQPMLPVAIEDLVAGLARDPELPTQMAHLLAFQQANHETQALVHHRTRFPRHRHLPPAIAGGRCYPCVRYKTSPMSRVGHTKLGTAKPAVFAPDATTSVRSSALFDPMMRTSFASASTRCASARK